MKLLLFILGAGIVGLTLGLMGSGGSILTSPVLVYLLEHDKNLAIGESLAIVGLIALCGAVPYAWSRRVVWPSVLYFGIPGIIGTVIGVDIGYFLNGPVKLILLALFMLVAAISMIRSRPKDANNRGPTDNLLEKPSAANDQTNRRTTPRWRMAIEGLAVGIVTGVVGTGGGFLIVPALVLLGGLSMHMAVGTSLVIIFLKSAIGFARFEYKLVQQDWNVELGQDVDWFTIMLFSAIGAIGTIAGNRIATRLNQIALRRAFAVLLVVMGAWIMYSELPIAFGFRQK